MLKDLLRNIGAGEAAKGLKIPDSDFLADDGGEGETDTLRFSNCGSGVDAGKIEEAGVMD